MKTAFLLGLSAILSMTAAAQKTDKWLKDLLYQQGSPLMRNILDHPETYKCQVIYTRIDRDKHNSPHFKSYNLYLDRNNYFNPASTVKLPTALVALEKLNDLHVAGLDKYTPMITDSAFSRQTRVTSDKSAADGLPSVAHYVKKIFLVSDNDAYNRLYEFDGQQTLNGKLWKKGYKHTRITRRFVSMNEEENRHTNPIRFIKDGKVVYEQPAAYSTVKFDFSRKLLIGNAHYDKDEVLVQGPMDFTTHNDFPLQDQQDMLKAVMFPESVSKKRRFNLTKEDYSFLYKYMSMLPGQSDYPKYDTKEFFDSYAKFFLYKADKMSIPDYMRVYSKAGWSYGFLTDNAYITDLKNNAEFMVTATIYVNSDGVINDNKYDYDTIGYPFFKELGEILYKYELQRERQYKPDLSKLK